MSAPERSVCDPCFGKDGRIGVVIGGISAPAQIMLYENKQWQSWKVQDIAGKDVHIEAAPFSMTREP